VGTVGGAAANNLVSDLWGGTDVVVAVDGSARLVRALLLRAAFTLGLAAIGWLFATLIASATASADETPPVVASGVAETVGTVTGTASTEAAPVSIPPAPVAVAAPAPEPVAAPAPVARAKPAAKRAAPRTKALVPKRKVAAVVADPPPPVAAPAPTATPETIGEDEANRSGKHPEPTKSPPAPVGSASSAHDGGGQARGGSGVLTATSPPRPLAQELNAGGHAADAGGRTAGLPVASPD
jgi:hypothetical protein